jgi:hypothetical protein
MITSVAETGEPGLKDVVEALVELLGVNDPTEDPSHF